MKEVYNFRKSNWSDDKNYDENANCIRFTERSYQNLSEQL